MNRRGLLRGISATISVMALAGVLKGRPAEKTGLSYAELSDAWKHMEREMDSRYGAPRYVFVDETALRAFEAQGK